MIDKIQVITNYHARDLVSGGGVMAEKVWVVTDGEYSGYHIIGAFSTEAKADEFVSLFGGRVEEWDLDPFQKAVRRGVRAWSVRMDEDGDNATATVRGVPEDHPRPYFYRRTLSYHYGFWGCVHAKTEKQAIKIANDKRRLLIAHPGLTDAFDYESLAPTDQEPA
jgi:hypothetical protein